MFRTWSVTCRRRRPEKLPNQPWANVRHDGTRAPRALHLPRHRTLRTAACAVLPHAHPFRPAALFSSRCTQIAARCPSSPHPGLAQILGGAGGERPFHVRRAAQLVNNPCKAIFRDPRASQRPFGHNTKARGLPPASPPLVVLKTPPRVPVDPQATGLPRKQRR